jgi:hypothetical protein
VIIGANGTDNGLAVADLGRRGSKPVRHFAQGPSRGLTGLFLDTPVAPV